MDYSFKFYFYHINMTHNMTYTEEQDKLRKKIMMRVYFAWFTKKIFNPLSIKAIVLFVFTWQIFVNVSISSVFSNAPSFVGGPNSLYKFFTYALMHTELIVQTLLAGLLVLLGWIVLDVVYSLKGGGHHVTSSI